MFRIAAAVRFLALAAALALAAPLAISVAHAETIKLTVNDQPITDVQIAQRARLLRLEQRGSSDSERLSLARQQLIEDALKLQEAERLGLTISEADIDAAILGIARNMRTSTDNLANALTQAGTSMNTLRDRLRAQLAWNKVAQAVIASRVTFSETELEQRAAAQMTPADGWDYFLKEVRFIIPAGSSASQQRRTADANAYRSRFSGCDSAVELSLSFTDAAVLDLGRRHATQLPEPIRQELAQLNVGGITTPRVVENGVSMLAICDKSAAQDLSFVTGQVRQEVGAELLQAEADKYMQDLLDDAQIVER